MRKLKLGFSDYTDANLETKTQAVIAAMTDNGHFPPPVPLLAALVTAQADFVAALAAAANRGLVEVAIKNQKREALITALVNLGNLVTLTAAGDEAILASTAFDLSKERTPMPPLANPEIKLVETSNPGEFTVQIGGVKGAKMYEFDYTPDPLTPASQWTSQNTTQVKYTFRNLESGKKYWCRVGAMGTNEQLVYSNPVARIVQ